MIKLKSILSEAKMVLRRKGGKEVTFTNKDNYEKAKKSGDYESPDKKKATKQDVDSDMYAQDTWKRFGGDTGTDADFQGEPPEGAREPEGEPETDLDINNFEDAKKVQVKIEDSHSQANRLEDDFYKSEEYKELKKGMSREEEIEIFDEIREKIRAVERQLSGAMHDDPNAGDYKDDKELQKRITTYKAKEVDDLSDDAKLFVRDPEAFKKELYKKKEGGGDFTKSADYDMWSDEDPEDAGEPDFYDPEDYEKLYPDKTKPKDEVGDIKYGKGFSPDSDHMFDSVAGSASSASDKYSELLDSVKSGNWKQFRSRIHDIYDEDAREHLLNLSNHVDSGTYKSEFPSGKKGLKFGRKEVMDLFRQAAEYGDEQFGGDEDDLEDPAGGKGDAWMHGKSEESITINGKKYKPITESIKPQYLAHKKEIKDFWNRMKNK